MRKIALIVLVFIAIGTLSFGKEREVERDMVPDAQVASLIADAVLVPIYGKEVLEQKPYKIRLADGHWIIDGVLHAKPGEVVVGGTVHIEIQKKDGAIRNVIHGK
ncbi:MAG: hypothetical protein A2X94_13560 [Bdellovibrionales bacterium GWB1_55_8]|nr:MAG: hypothetical protein A2X94_13560 [Bdellovibrionales bacterium GWB1_55_8]